MRVRVDENRCTGHARCNAEAGQFYQLDDLGFNLLAGHEVAVPPHLEGAAARGAAACPERAIVVSS
jgi:ferredoxin